MMIQCPFIVILPLQSKLIAKEKMFIADVDKVGRLGYNATTIKGNVLVLEHVLWAYFLDTSSLLLSLVRSKINGSVRASALYQRFGSGIKSYNGYLNGKWILFEHDSKTKKITHNFSDDLVAEGANDLKLVVNNYL
jgi:hypothetical protein